MEASGQRHAPAIYPGERDPGTLWIGGWVGPSCWMDNIVFIVAFQMVEQGTAI